MHVTPNQYYYGIAEERIINPQRTPGTHPYVSGASARMGEPVRSNFVDNAALAKFMVRGSRIPYPHSRVRNIVATLALHNVRVKVIWIPREENRGSDKMSKTIVQERLDQEDYTLH